MNLALYIHWPFCKKKCPYCDFNSHVRGEIDHARYRRALLTELRHMHSLMPDATLTSIFFGGGTPSLMHPETAAALIEEAKNFWPLLNPLPHRGSGQGEGAAAISRTLLASPSPNLSPNEGEEYTELEITLEANPTSVEAETFAAFRDAGINRVSLGIQSLRAESLTFLGREHSADEALAALALAKKHFARYSFDLIYALPNQTIASWDAELREALQYAGGHMSLYQLTIEPNTAFHTAYFGKHAFTLPDEMLAAELYQHTQTVMEQAGLPAYEISNHAGLGEESRHNLSYWRSDAYIGIGPGAHGRIVSSLRAQRGNPVDSASGTDGWIAASASPPRNDDDRIWLSTITYKTPERWLDIVERDGHAIEHITEITPSERMEEKLLMGLRLTEGLPLSRFTPEERAHLDARVSMQRLHMLEAEGLLTITGTHWHTTQKGRLVLNSIISSLLS